ncbi:hypothetical protein JCM11251_000685 [Rhodosporidiobolus azoricus]
MNVVQFNITYRDTLRKIPYSRTLPASPYASILVLIKERFNLPNVPQGELVVQDEVGDSVTISSDTELRELFTYLEPTTKTLRLELRSARAEPVQVEMPEKSVDGLFSLDSSAKGCEESHAEAPQDNSPVLQTVSALCPSSSLHLLLASLKTSTDSLSSEITALLQPLNPSSPVDDAEGILGLAILLKGVFEPSLVMSNVPTLAETIASMTTIISSALHRRVLRLEHVCEGMDEKLKQTRTEAEQVKATWTKEVVEAAIARSGLAYRDPVMPSTIPTHTPSDTALTASLNRPPRSYLNLLSSLKRRINSLSSDLAALSHSLDASTPLDSSSGLGKVLHDFSTLCSSTFAVAELPSLPETVESLTREISTQMDERMMRMEELATQLGKKLSGLKAEAEQAQATWTKEFVEGAIAQSHSQPLLGLSISLEVASLSEQASTATLEAEVKTPTMSFEAFYEIAIEEIDFNSDKPEFEAALRRAWEDHQGLNLDVMLQYAREKSGVEYSD